MKRQLGLAQAQARLMATQDSEPCALCGRQLGSRVERHHRVPKSQGGVETVPVHPICHRMIHACATNRELATTHAALSDLRQRDEMARFLRWIGDKPPDFNAPTRRRVG